MAEFKNLKTRIVLTHDDYANLKTKHLKDGEVVLAKVGEITEGNVTQPVFMMKVGTSETTKTVAELPWLMAPAADVYDWAKKENLEVAAVPTLPTSKIDGLDKALEDLAAEDERLAGLINGINTAIGTKDDATTAETVYGYINKKTSGIASEGKVTELTEKVEALEDTINGVPDGDEGLVSKVDTLLSGNGDIDVEGSVENIAFQAIAAHEFGDVGVDKAATIDSTVIKTFDNKAAINKLNGNKNTVGSVDYKIDNFEYQMNPDDADTKFTAYDLMESISTLEGDTTTAGSVDNKIDIAIDKHIADTKHLTESEVKGIVEDHEYTYKNEEGSDEIFTAKELYVDLGIAHATADEALEKINAFMDANAASDDTIDTLKEIIALIESEDNELSTSLMTEINKLKEKFDADGKALEAVNADTVDGKHADDFAAAVHTHTVEDIDDFPDIEGMIGNALNDYITTEEVNDKISQSEEDVKSELIGYAETATATDNTIIGAKKYADSLSTNYATAAQGAKADTAIQEITTTANNGLKVTVDATDNTKVNIDIDNDIVFILDGGTAADLD